LANKAALKNLFILFSLVIFIFITSCDDKSTSNESDPYEPTSTFPLTTGSWWHYEGFIEYGNFSDSIYSDTFDLYIARHVIGLDTAYFIGDVIMRDDTIIVDFGYLDTTVCRKWMKINNNKLILYASDCEPPGYDLEPNMYDEPITLLDFPLDNQKTWSNDIGNGHHENFEVVGTEYLEIDTGWRVCDVINADVLNDANGGIESSTFKWYCDDGLMIFQQQNQMDYGESPPPGIQIYKEFRVVDKNIVQ
jgi:hypothetical protein